MTAPEPRAATLGELIARFPGLERIGRALRERAAVPVILQLTMLDCGPACLAMVLGHLGRKARLDEVRERMGVGRDGATARAILECARSYGLRARGIRVELDDLPLLTRGSVLHWEFNHFVVFERVVPGGIVIVDPAQGRRLVKNETVATALTGIALLFEPTSTFDGRLGGRRSIWGALIAALSEDRRWVRIGVISVIMQTLALSVPVMTGLIADRIVPDNDLHLFTVAALGLLGVIAFNLVASLIRAHLLLEFRTRLDVQMSVGLVEHLTALPFGFFARRSAGDLMMRINSSRAVRDILTASTLSALVDGTMIVAYLGLLVVAVPRFAAIVSVLVALQVLVFACARPRLQALSAEHLSLQTRTQGCQVELLAGMESLKAMGVEASVLERWLNHFVDESNVAIARGRVSAAVEAVAGSLRLTAPLITLMVGAHLVISGQMSLGTMLAAQALSMGVLLPVVNLLNAGEQLLLLRSYLERMDDILAVSPECEAPGLRMTPGRLTGAVQLEHVSFSYSPLSSPVVRDVCVQVEAGQFVAIVGHSGSGKSTLAALLLGLHPPTSGRILYDGLDLARLDLRAVRRQFGVVPQSPYVFGMSVRQNIAMVNPDLTFDEVESAAIAAELHGDIQGMPMGYETLVSDGGSAISGGQRQRLALARALAGRPSMLLLDEATSALDAVTEARVQGTIARLGCTRIVIAHRLSTIIDADVVLVMKEGQIVERGTHDELLRRGGEYHRLIHAQLQEYRLAGAVERELAGTEGL